MPQLKNKLLLIVTLTLLAVSTVVCVAETPSKPNIIMIMADDMGYESLQANGSEISTPEIDRLAEEGLRLNQFFANPICTPSRVKLMTGQYNVRNYVKFGVLDRSQTTFAHQLKQAGYTTAIAGKWQLGSEVDSPTHFGFDQACLWQHTRKRLHGKHDTRYANPRLEINGEEVNYTNGEYGPDICAQFLCDFIETNQDRPFIVYYPMILPHWPFSATPDSSDWDPESMGSTTNHGPGDAAEQERHFHEMVTYADKLVGKIVKQLEDLGLRENTLIVFVGDNGNDKTLTTQLNGRAIKGGKGSVTENGTRVPLVMNWPGVIEPKVMDRELAEFSDFLPTFCELTGAPLPDCYSGDGVSLVPLMTGSDVRDKPYVYVWHNGTAWARMVDFGVLQKKGKGSAEYQRFGGHYDMEVVASNAIQEQERETFEKLEAVIQSLAKVRPSERKAKKSAM